jgi:WD40 repeat protein
MDRFVQQWQRRATGGSCNHTAQLDDDLPEDDADEEMEDFIAPEDDEDEDEEDDVEDAHEDQYERAAASSGASMPKRIKLQLKTASSSSSKKKKKASHSAARATDERKDPIDLTGSTASAAASSHSTAAAISSTVSAASKPLTSANAASKSAASSIPPNAPSTQQVRRQAEKLTAKQAFRASQQERKSNERTSSSTSEIADSLVRSNSSSHAKPSRTPSTGEISSAPPAAASAAAASSATVAARKRKRVLLPEEAEEKEQSRLIDLIQDDDDLASPSLNLARSLSSPESRESPSPVRPVPPPTLHHFPRSLLGLLHATRSNGSQAFPGVGDRRMRQLREKRREEAIGRWMKEESEGTIASTRSLNPPSADQPAACYPALLSSPFSALHTLHKGLYHNVGLSLWSAFTPVLDWSLTGTFGAGVRLDAQPARQIMTSYVNHIEFDPHGVLLTASSTDGKVALYDFELVWHEGREVEKRRRREKHRKVNERMYREWMVEKAKSKSPPRAGKWKLNQAPPAVRPDSDEDDDADGGRRRRRRPHEFISPVFEMNLHPGSSSDTGEGGSSNQQHGLKQIDSHHWSTYNPNEIAVASQRSNQIYIFDLTRTNSTGSPCKRVLACDPLHASAFGTGVMDFQWFPNLAGGGSGSGSGGIKANSQCLIAALRSGELNVIDLRAPAASSHPGVSPASVVASTALPRLHRSQTRGSSSLTTRLAHTSSNPPASLHVSSSGTLVRVFTQHGSVEVWDLRMMQARYEKVLLLDAMAENTKREQEEKRSSGAVLAPASASSTASPLGFSFHHSSSRVCSSSVHPQDDLLFSFQLLNGCVGMIDLNTSSPTYRQCKPIVPYDENFISASPDPSLSMRPRRSHAFLTNFQVGGGAGSAAAAASARREKCLVVGNTKEELEIWEACESVACEHHHYHQSSHAKAKSNVATSAAAAASSARDHAANEEDGDSFMLARELMRSADIPVATVASSNLHLLNRFSLRGASSDEDEHPLPCMSIAAHPRVPYLMIGSTEQRIRIATHRSELEED